MFIIIDLKGLTLVEICVNCLLILLYWQCVLQVRLLKDGILVLRL